MDDEIYEDFSKTFPKYIENPELLVKLDEDQVKSKEGKEQWREFMNRFVEGFLYGWDVSRLIPPFAKIREED